MTQLDQTYPNNSSQDDGINIKELFGLLWGGKYLIITITAVFALSSILYALSLQDYYKSLSYAAISGSENTGTFGTGFGAIAGAAGITLTNDVRGPLIINTINSREFFKHLISVDENVLPALVAAKSYDSESKKLVFDSDIYDAANKKWLVEEPSYIAAFGAYMRVMKIEYREIRRMVNLSAEHLSPIFAKEFLDLIMREADDLIRQADLQRASEALTFLEIELSKASLLSVKSGLSELILSQLQTQMLAQLSADYIISVIEPPFIPLATSKPSRSLIFMLGTLAGFVLGCFLIVIRHYNPLTAVKQTAEPSSTVL